jgi:GAF domain-containing protein
MAGMVTEAARVATLKGYGVLDTPNEPAFDAIVRDVARTFGVRSALVSFIDEDRQWYKARFGVDAHEVPRSISFCTHSIGRDDVTVVLDARADARFAANPFVTGKDPIRFYAGAPIKAANGARIGTVCLFDPQPRREFTAQQQQKLASFAERVMALVVARAAAPAGRESPRPVPAPTR